MRKTVEIEGIKYTYDDELWVVVLSTTDSGSDDKLKHIYYSNGLENRSIEKVERDIRICLSKLIGLVVTCSDYQCVYYFTEESGGVYDEHTLILREGERAFWYKQYYGQVKPIEEEIKEMVKCGCAKELFGALLTYCAVEIQEGNHKILGYEEQLVAKEYYAPREYDNRNYAKIVEEISDVPKFYFC